MIASDIEQALQTIRKHYGEDAAMTFTDNTAKDITFLSTGSLGLDIALGGGVPLGRIVEIFSAPSCGKTTLALQICAEAQRKGYGVAYFDFENGLERNYMKALGCDLDTMVISQPNSGEDAFNIAEIVIKQGFKVLVFDSVASMLTKAELEGEVGDSYIAVQARMMSMGLKKLTPLITKYDCLCVFLNQTRTNVGVLYGSNETTPGGQALRFYASQRIRMSRTTSPIKEGNDAIGNETKAKVVKNKVAPPFREASFKIIYGKGVYKRGEILTLAVENNLITKAGSYYKYNGETIGQGEAKATSWLEENPKVEEELTKEIMKKLIITEDEKE